MSARRPLAHDAAKQPPQAVRGEEFMLKIFCVTLAFVLTGVVSASAQSAPPADAVKELAPGGTLRAAINVGNVVLAHKDETGQVHGASVDLARELAVSRTQPAALRPARCSGRPCRTLASRNVSPDA